jgi:hypothetical protein
MLKKMIPGHPLLDVRDRGEEGVRWGGSGTAFMTRVAVGGSSGLPSPNMPHPGNMVRCGMFREYLGKNVGATEQV